MIKRGKIITCLMAYMGERDTKQIFQLLYCHISKLDRPFWVRSIHYFKIVIFWVHEIKSLGWLLLNNNEIHSKWKIIPFFFVRSKNRLKDQRSEFSSVNYKFIVFHINLRKLLISFLKLFKNILQFGFPAIVKFHWALFWAD